MDELVTNRTCQAKHQTRYTTTTQFTSLQRNTYALAYARTPHHLCVPRTRAETRAKSRHRPTPRRPLASGARSRWSCPPATHTIAFLTHTDQSRDAWHSMLDLFDARACEDRGREGLTVSISSIAAHKPVPNICKHRQMKFVNKQANASQFISLLDTSLPPASQAIRSANTHIANLHFIHRSVP